MSQWNLEVIDKNIRRSQLGIAAILTVVMIWSGWIIVSSWGVHQSLTSWDITFLRFTTAAIVTAPPAVSAARKFTACF